MLDNVKTTRAWVRNSLDRGAQVLIALHWDEEHKRWVAVGSVHGPDRVRVVTNRIETTAGMDVDELRRLLGAIRQECESWLF